MLAGHAAFQTFSVLTRLPGVLRLSTGDASTALKSMFGQPCWLDVVAQTDLFDRLEHLGVAGVALYDALVGEAARVNRRHLLTNDMRAARTYALIGVHFELVGT